MEVLQKHRTLSLQEAKIKTLSLFEQVKLQDPLTVFSKYPHQLSGGQKQRVMIAMGISCDPELLICDEPTTALDATVQKNILELLKEIQKTKGLGILFITHDLGVVASFAHRVVVMKNGRIVETGKTEQVLKNPTHDYTKGLLNCRPGLYKKGERLPDLSSTPTQPKENIPISANVNIWKTTPSNWLIQAKDVCIGYHQKSSWRKKSQKSLWTLNKVSFDIFEGETIGLVGESGSGKSTIGKALAGLLPINQGSLAYRGNTNAWNIPAERKKLSRLIQFVFQDPYSSLNPKMTVEETLMEPLTVHSIYNSAVERKKRVQFLLEKVGLGSSALNRFPHEFSGGQRQRIVIARALTMQPQLLICDESVSALDVSVQAQVLNLLNDLKSEFGLTLLFISHDLAVIRYMSDRIMVLNKGKLEEMGPAEDICAHPSSLYTKQLLDAMPVL